MDGRGAILRVDLSTEKITKEPLTPELCRRYIGGEGINTYLFWQHFLKVDPKIDPISEDNILIWGMGPLGGTPFGGGSKSRWTCKGPAYSLFADSNSGGRFGTQMRWAGYDHLVVTGKARHPVYIRVNNDNVEIRDASHLWGKKVTETDEAIKQELGDGEVQTAGIGPGGENLVTYASVTESCYRAAGRTGCGCVFGSKNLKAIAARGTKGISVHDRAAFLKAIPALLAAINVNTESRKAANKSGSLRQVVSHNDNGWNGYRNGQRGQSPQADKIGGQWYFDHMQQRPLSCSPGCAAVCQGWHYIKGNESPLAARYIGDRGQRPEYGMAGSFGTNCDIPDLPAVAHLMGMCNQYSLDIFETGMSIAFMMELWQRGIITAQDVIKWAGEPLSLEWGNIEAVEKVVDAIATQSNQLGRILRRGVYQAARQIEELKGVPVLQYANYGKGHATHEGTMRSRPQAAVYATLSAIGSHHLKGSGMDQKSSLHYFGRPDAANPWSYTLKGAAQAVSEYMSSLYNSLGVCKRSGADQRQLVDFSPELYAPALYALTGQEITPQELYTAGKRIVNMQKAFNSCLGLRRQDDTLCHRWMNEPATDGPARGMRVADHLEQAKDEYYEYHGWDKATSLQKREKLIELGLEDIVGVLEREKALA